MHKFFLTIFRLRILIVHFLWEKEKKKKKFFCFLLLRGKNAIFHLKKIKKAWHSVLFISLKKHAINIVLFLCCVKFKKKGEIKEKENIFFYQHLLPSIRYQFILPLNAKRKFCYKQNKIKKKRSLYSIRRIQSECERKSKINLKKKKKVLPQNLKKD